MSKSAKSCTPGLKIDRVDSALLKVSTLKNPLSSKTACMVTATSGSSSIRSILLFWAFDFACDVVILNHPLDTWRE
jgi:hypothetical protein